MSESYDKWFEQVVVQGHNAKPLNSGELVKSSAGQAYNVIEFLKIDKPHFLAEVARKGEQYIYHFYPKQESDDTNLVFALKLADALIEVFKREDQVECAWTPEMKAWAVRVSGWCNHVWGDDLAIRAIDRLEELLQATETSS